MSRHILVIDDDLAVREALRRVLEQAGYRVSLAAAGLHGLSLLKQQHFDALVLDLDLPDVTGFDVLDQGFETAPTLPVIILTGMSEHCPPGSLTGAIARLQKPADAGVLLATLDRSLSLAPDTEITDASESSSQPGS